MTEELAIEMREPTNQSTQMHVTAAFGQLYVQSRTLLGGLGTSTLIFQFVIRNSAWLV